MDFKGPKSVFRDGIFYVISSKNDHPIALMEAQSFIVKPSTYEHVGLSVEKVDRSRLTDGNCYQSTDDVRDWWPMEMEYTKTNCDLFVISRFMNCSMAGYQRYTMNKERKDLRKNVPLKQPFHAISPTF